MSKQLHVWIIISHRAVAMAFLKDILIDTVDVWHISRAAYQAANICMS